MSLKLYMDVHVPWPITAGLLRRGVDVLTAQEDRAAEFDDGPLLDRALWLGRVLFSQDEDLLAETAARQQQGVPFAGVIYAHQQNLSFRQAIEDLELVAQVCDPGELANRVVFLPLH